MREGRDKEERRMREGQVEGKKGNRENRKGCELVYQ